MAHDYSGGDPWAGLKEGMDTVNQTLSQLAVSQRQRKLDTQNSALAALALEKGQVDLTRERMGVSKEQAEQEALMKVTGTNTPAEAYAKQAEITQQKQLASDDQTHIKSIMETVKQFHDLMAASPDNAEQLKGIASQVVQGMAGKFNEPKYKEAFGKMEITPAGAETTIMVHGDEGYKHPLTGKPLDPGEWKLDIGKDEKGQPKIIKADFVKQIDPETKTRTDEQLVHDSLKEKLKREPTASEVLKGVNDLKTQRTQTTVNIHTTADISKEDRKEKRKKASELGIGKIDQPLAPALEDHAKMIAAGTESPSSLPKRQGSYLIILSRAHFLNPNLDIREQDINTKLMGSATFRQKIIGTESMDGILQSMVNAGKKVNFSHLKVAGIAEKWAKGQVNDPDLVEYMTLRNDALLSVASIMRGVGATDQAHRVEIEAASPTLDPPALDAWLKAQRVSLAPRLKAYQKIESKSGATGSKSGKIGKYSYTVE